MYNWLILNKNTKCIYKQSIKWYIVNRKVGVNNLQLSKMQKIIERNLGGKEMVGKRTKLSGGFWGYKMQMYDVEIEKG